MVFLTLTQNKFNSSPTDTACGDYDNDVYYTTSTPNTQNQANDESKPMIINAKAKSWRWFHIFITLAEPQGLQLSSGWRWVVKQYKRGPPLYLRARQKRRMYLHKIHAFHGEALCHS